MQIDLAGNPEALEGFHLPRSLAYEGVREFAQPEQSNGLRKLFSISAAGGYIGFMHPRKVCIRPAHADTSPPY